MKEILLTDPIPSDAELERLHLFPGRHLGEEEFDRKQAYVDRRIEPLLNAKQPGIVDGLQVRVGSIGDGEGFTVGPGLALAANGLSLGLYFPLRQSWRSVVEQHVDETQVTDAAGVYYLILRRSHRYVDADPDIEPCQRAEFDPTRDARRVVVGSIALKKLAIDPAAIAGNSRERIENWVAANNVDANFLHNFQTAVPLGLLAVANNGSDTEGNPLYSVPWFSEAAGRYRAVANSGYHVLLRQTTEAYRRLLLAAAGDPRDTLTYLLDEMQLDFLPAAGELPGDLIQNIASTSPSIAWLPPHIGADMVAVPEESVNELIERHLPRRVIDLRQPAGDRIRILLAVNEPDYKANLLDYPQTDAQLHSDVFRYSMRAHRTWMAWMQKFNELYFLEEEDVLDPEQLKSLDLPKPVAAPQLPRDYFNQVIAESRTEVGEDNNNQLYYPYNQGPPDYPLFYRDWGVEDGGDEDNPVLPPPVEDPPEDGLVIRYSIAQVELEALDNEIRATRERLELTRDYLILQRQQLDSQTVSLASLAGGVAGDGSGLQVARWLPFSRLTAAKPEPESSDGNGEEGETDTGTARAESQTPILKYQAIQPESFNIANNLSFTKTSQNTVLQNAVKAQPKISSNNFIYTSTLRKTPSALSSIQFNLNNLRLNKIAEAPKKALTKPAFEAKEFRFGVLEHIRPEVQEYKKVQRGMTELLSTLDGMFDIAEAKSIKSRLRAFGTPKSLESLGIGDDTIDSDELTANIYEAIFAAGRILTKQITYMEGRYARIEAKLEGKLRSRLRLENKMEKLAALIAKATQELENLDKRRIEFLGDYGVAQRLLDDDWLDIFHQNQERTRILTTAVRGVYYVRERQTPISQQLADPLHLRYGKASDIVPGCDWEEDPELPEELEDFFDTVQEVPMADWAALKDLQVYIPPINRLNYIAKVRQTRLQSKTAYRQQLSLKARPVAVSLFGVRQQSFSLLHQLARRDFSSLITSAKRRERETAKVMSLQDIVTGGRGRLQREAQVLNQRLEQALACILEKLDALPPSLRLQWAQLAEDDRLAVAEVGRWPGLERAERDDFNATRTLAELIAWWFRQLADGASAEARAAMDNMIRAAVIHAALGDPTEILHGEVQVPPRRLALGEPLRLKLNRRAKTGTVMQLMDTQQRLVAWLSLDDDDDRGAVATVTKVTRANTTIDTRFTVVASKLTRQMRL